MATVMGDTMTAGKLTCQGLIQDFSLGIRTRVRTSGYVRA
jgi:hypothetical protein